MTTENIHLLRHEIHSSFNTSDFNSDTFLDRLANSLVDHPTETSQNYHMYSRAMREYNRKLDNLGLESRIVQPIGAGFTPIDVLLSFADVFTPGVLDFIELENDSFLLQENLFKLVLEQDV